MLRQRGSQRHRAAGRGVVHHHDVTSARELGIHRLRDPRGRHQDAWLGQSDDALQAFHPAARCRTIEGMASARRLP